jgi:hypothetical protein
MAGERTLKCRVSFHTAHLPATMTSSASLCAFHRTYPWAAVARYVFDIRPADKTSGTATMVPITKSTAARMTLNRTTDHRRNYSHRRFSEKNSAYYVFYLREQPVSRNCIIDGLSYILSIAVI